MDAKADDRQSPFSAQEFRFDYPKNHYEYVPAFHRALVKSVLADTTRQTVIQSKIRERR